MSRHWNPRPAGAGGRPSRQPRRRNAGRSRFRAGEIRLVLLAGLFAGLAYASFGSGQLGSAAPAEAAAGTARSSAPAAGGERVDDPWAVAITDGDTFRYRGDKIRIADIDTPEIRGRCDYETGLAARATERMEALLRQGPFEMRPIPGRDEDRYGRKLRVVIRDGRSLGDQLVAEGLARTWEGKRRPWCGADAD